MYGLTEEALKRRLAARGARVPAGEVVATPAAAAQVAARVGGPVMVKALVALKDRAGLGLIRRAADSGTAAEVAADLLANTDPPVDRLLVETQAAEGAEYYLAAVFDHVAGRPIVLFGAGGSGVEHRAEAPRPVGADMDGHWDRTAVPAELASTVDALLAEFYALRALTLEINPVRITADGAVVLDAKATLDPAVPVPEDAIVVQAEDPIGEKLHAEAAALRGGTEVRFGQLDGDIGVVSAGGGVLAIVHDAFRRYGLRPANFADVSGGSATTPLLGAVAREVVARRPRGVLVATGITSSVSVVEFARAMAVALAPLAELDPPPPIVARMAGMGEEEAVDILRPLANCLTVGKDVTVDEAVGLLAARLAPELTSTMAEA